MNDGTVLFTGGVSGSSIADRSAELYGPLPVPTITGFSPGRGTFGNSIIITGTGFSNLRSVKFNTGSATNYFANSTTQITATLPNSATTGKISVVTVGGTAISAADFVVDNLAPVAQGQSVTTFLNAAKQITLVATDANTGDTLTYSIVTAPTKGTLGPINGKNVTYTPNTGYVGSDSFTFKVNDGTVDSNIVTVSLSVFEAPPLIVSTTRDDSANNDGLVSLREAINYANSGNAGANVSITFASGVTGTISLLGSGLTLNRNMAIHGPGANLLTVKPAVDFLFAVFTNNSTSNSTLRGLTIARGNRGITNNGLLTLTGCVVSDNQSTGLSGGGIFSNGSSLTLFNCTVSDNKVTSAANTATGGGIYSNGSTVNLTGCTFSGNTATGGGSGSGAGGGIYSTSNTPLKATNCTFFGNSAGATGTGTGNFGGGIHSAGSVVTLANCTLSGNTAQNGGGLYNSIGSTFQVGNSIVAGNTSSGTSPDVLGAFTSQGNNLIGNRGTATGFSNGVSFDQVGTSVAPRDALFDTTGLKDNGGLTQTLALGANSPAIDKGNSSQTTDQRGAARPSDNGSIANAGSGNGSDIGAYEVRPPNVLNFTPTMGPVGTSVTIFGNGFVGVSAVFFNGTAATNYTINSTSQMTATVPSGATTGKISVTTPDGTATSMGDFTVNTRPLFSNPSYNFTFTQNQAISGAKITATDADGDTLTYSLSGGPLPSGIALNADGTFSGTPSSTSLALTRTASVSDGKGGTALVTVTIQVSAGSGALISEFRFRGTSSTDEYVEIHNTLGAPLNISGWSIRNNTGSANAPIFQNSAVPANTLVPAFGHFLFTGTGYSLTSYGASDMSIGADVADDSGVSLFNAAGALQDAAGFDTSLTTLREGAGLASAPSGSSQSAFMRRFKGQLPVDSGDNAADFLLLTTDGAAVAGTSIAPQLGAPNPEGLASPVNINALVGVRVLDANFGPNVSPNRIRIGSGNGGSLVFRRIIKNNTNQPLSRIRLLITDITGQVSPVVAGQADVRVTSQADENVAVAGQGTVLVYGTTLEAPSNAPTGTGLTTVGGGGIGSSVNYDIVLTTPLAAGAERPYGFNVQVAKTGSFFVNINLLGK